MCMFQLCKVDCALQLVELGVEYGVQVNIVLPGFTVLFLLLLNCVIKVLYMTSAQRVCVHGGAFAF